MDKIYKAKEIYNSVEIPPELEVAVNSAIENGSVRKVKKLSIVKTLAPVAVCAVICLALGLGGVLKNLQSSVSVNTGVKVNEKESQTQNQPATAAIEPEQSAGARAFVPDSLSEAPLPFNEPIDMTYSSGAGAWITTLELNNDGTFSGYFRDANAGEIGKDYPNGTIHESAFNGAFFEIVEVDDFTYSMKLGVLNVEGEGREHISDGIRYVASKPYGLDGEEFLFYLPQKPLSCLTEQQRFFWHGDLFFEELPETISCHAVINTTEDTGFFSYFSE